MKALGYVSYELRENRFHQRIENFKPDKLKGSGSRNEVSRNATFQISTEKEVGQSSNVIATIHQNTGSNKSSNILLNQTSSLFDLYNNSLSTLSNNKLHNETKLAEEVYKAFQYFDRQGMITYYDDTYYNYFGRDFSSDIQFDYF